MASTVEQAYPLAALLIHATKQEVTKEKMNAIFKTLGLEISPKLASFFELSPEKYSNILSNIGGSSSVPSGQSAAAPGAAKQEAAAKEEESSQELDLDF